MKNIKYLFFLTLLSTFLCSCEEVIDLKLTGKEAKYVVEGTITNVAGDCAILISKTKNFDDDNQFIGVSGAVVTIENNGMITTLPETSPGVYKSETYVGTPGQTYKLSIVAEGNTFTGTSTMPAVVPFEDFYMKPADFDKERTDAFVKFKDPLETKNFYWFELYVNDKRQRYYSVMNDDYTPGQEVNTTVTFENITDDETKDLKKGDELSVNMHCVDEAAYLYLFTLNNAEGSDFGASPANPVSNLTGGALGVFSAHTVQKRSLIIP